MLQDKTKMAEDVIGEKTSEEWTAKLNNDEILDLFKYTNKLITK